MLLSLDSVFGYRVRMDYGCRYGSFMERTCYHVFCWEFDLQYTWAQVTQFVCDRWAVPQAVSYCLLKCARIRPHPPTRTCWLWASKHSHATFCHQWMQQHYYHESAWESIASKLSEIIWSHSPCLQLKCSQRNCILCLCCNGCELQLIYRDKARRQIVMQQRANSHHCLQPDSLSQLLVFFFGHKSDRNVYMNG